MHHAGPEILHRDIGFLGKAIDDLLSRRGFEIQRQGSLVAVPRQVVRAFVTRHPLVVEGHGAEQVALSRPLDLDDIGAHVAQQLRAERPLQQMAEIEDGDVAEGFMLHCGRYPYLACNPALLSVKFGRPLVEEGIDALLPIGRCKQAEQNLLFQ